MNRHMVKKILILTFLFININSFALDSDRQKVIKVEADSASLNQKEHLGKYIGRVLFIQGTTRLTADEAETFGNEQNKLTKAVARGNKKHQAHYKSKTAMDKPDMNAYADTIEYYPQKHLIVLKGRAKITQGKNSFSAELIKYDTLKKHVISKGSKNTRIKMVFYPEKNRGGKLMSIAPGDSPNKSG